MMLAREGDYFPANVAARRASCPQFNGLADLVMRVVRPVGLSAGFPQRVHGAVGWASIAFVSGSASSAARRTRPLSCEACCSSAFGGDVQGREVKEVSHAIQKRIKVPCLLMSACERRKQLE